MSFRTARAAGTLGADVLRGLLDDVARLKRLSAAIGSGSTPAGAMVAYAGASAPSGWVLCDGSSYDGTDATYAALFAAIGLTYGGSGSAFHVPDMRGRAPFGVGTNADVSTRGASDGLAVASRSAKHNHSASHSLTLPSHGHSHSLTLPDHAHSVSDPGHNHQEQASNQVGGGGGVAYSTDMDNGSPANTTFNMTNGSFTGVSVGGATSLPAIAGSVGNPTSSPPIDGTVSVGPGGSRPTDAPAYLVVEFIIKL